MDTQDDFMKHKKITKDTIGCAFEVINELNAGLSAQSQQAIKVLFRNKNSHNPVYPVYPVYPCKSPLLRILRPRHTTATDGGSVDFAGSKNLPLHPGK